MNPILINVQGEQFIAAPDVLSEWPGGAECGSPIGHCDEHLEDVEVP